MAVIAGVLGVLVSPVVIAAIQTVPDKQPLRGGFPSRRDLPRWAVPVAVINGVLWALAADKFMPPWYVATSFLLFFSALLVVSVIDLQVYRIPDRITFPVLGASFVLLTGVTYARITDLGETADIMRYALVGMVAYFVLLFIPHLISPKGMGFGDVKLSLVMGLHLGWLVGISTQSWFDAVRLTIYAFFLGCLLGVVLGIGFRVIRRGSDGAFPFGPALAAAAVYVALVFDNLL